MSFNTYSLGNWELLKACMAREWLLMKRNSFVHVFKSTQVMDRVTSNFCVITYLTILQTANISHLNLFTTAYVRRNGHDDSVYTLTDEH